MEQNAGVQEDRYYDPLLGMEITRSGRARRRQQLEDARASRDNAGLAELREQLRRGPSAA